MNLLGFLVTVIVLESAVSGVPLSHDVESNEISSDDFVSGLNKCALQTDSDGIASCATERIVKSLNMLSSQPNIEISPGVSLLSESGVPNFRSGKELKEEIEEAKSNHGSMLELIGNATQRFFAGRTLKVKLPTSEEIGRALEEGRKRKGNKKGGMSMGMLGIGAAIAGLVPLFMGKIALITAKALIVGKIAFVLSAFLLIQMLLGNRGNKNNSAESSWSSAPQVSYNPPSNSYGPPATSYGVPSGQYPYSRSFSIEDQSKYSQELAYAAQRR